MARNKIKTETISPDLMLEIKNRFKSMWDFYRMAGLTMSQDDFYRVLRGEEETPDRVQAVEVGYMKVMDTFNMSPKEMVKVLSKIKSDDLGDDTWLMEQCRMIVCAYINKGDRK